MVQPNPWNPGEIRDFGVETVLFFVGQKSLDFNREPFPSLVRPFYDLNNRQESGFVVAASGLASGGIDAHVQSNLWGGEINAWKNVYYNSPGTNCTFDMMAGFRYLSGDQQVRIASTSLFNPNLPLDSIFLPFAGNRLDVFDSFTTHNRFYGGQIGVSSKCWPIPRLSIEGTFKLGLGVTNEHLNITGSQVRVFPNGTTTTSNSGLLALASNSGNFRVNKFAQVPEASFKISYDVMKNLSLSTGFSALYWSRIVRATQQIDRGLDITQIPNFPPAAGAIPTGLGRPAVLFEQSDLWALGISFGIELKW
jgi:hypothetical protein